MDGVLWTKAVYHLDFSFRMSIIFSVFIFLQEIDCFFLHFHASLSFQRSEIWLLLRTEEKWKTEKNRNVKNKECSQCWWTLVTKIVTVHIDYWNIFHQLVEMIEYAHCASWLHFHIYSSWCTDKCPTLDTNVLQMLRISGVSCVWYILEYKIDINIKKIE